MTNPELREKSRDFWHFCRDFIKRESGQEFRETGIPKTPDIALALGYSE